MVSNPLEPFPYRLILGSGSPRRKELLEKLDIPYEIRVLPIEEHINLNLKPWEVAEDLAQRKAEIHEVAPDELLLTADTVVYYNGHFLEKPADRAEAIASLTQLQGHTHDVFTGVALTTADKQRVFHGHTRVTFRALSQAEIEFYIDRDAPFDKAGGYGAQDWLGLTGVSKIEGTFYNVMGLPIDLVYQELLTFKV